MSAGLFEESEILVKHIDPVSSILDTLKRTKLGDGSEYKKFIQTEIGQKLSSFTSGIEEVIELKVPTEFKSSSIQISEKIRPIINDLDYLCHWLTLAETQLRAFQAQVPFFELRWGLPAITRICKIFVFYIKSIIALQAMSNDILNCYIIFRLAEQSPSTTTLCSKEWLEKILTAARKSPLLFISQQLLFLKQSFSNLVTMMIPIFTPIFGLHSTFDWSIISVDNSEFENSKNKSTLPSSALLVLQNCSLFRDMIFCCSLIFPETFEENIQFSDLLIRVIGDCAMINLTQYTTIHISEIFQKSPNAPTLSDQILISTRQSNMRMNSSHLIRMNILIALFCDFEDNISVDPTVLSSKADEIMALVGISFYELITSLMKNIEDSTLLDLISHLVKMVDFFESNKEDIQRTYLFNLVSLDVPYMSDLLALFGRTCSSNEAPVILMIRDFCTALNQLDLEQFDKGVRYDFMPLLLTHGRLIHHSLTKQTGSSSYLNPVLEHLLTIRRHVELCENPHAKILRACPLAKTVPFLPMISKIISSNSFNFVGIADVKEIIAFFKYVPIAEDSTAVFNNICEDIVNKALNTLLDFIAIPSKHVQIARQCTFDAGFQPNAFSPYTSANILASYKVDAESLKKMTQAASLVTRLPETIQYGETKVNLRLKFISNFFPQICRSVINTTTNPLTMQSILFAIQSFKLIFESFNIPLFSTIYEAIRSSSQLQSGGSLSIQSQAFMGGAFSVSSSQFLCYYVEELEKFLAGDYENTRYEPLGRKFVGKSRSSKQYELLFSFMPITNIIQTFGITVAIKIDTILIKHIVNSLTSLFQIFQSVMPDLTVLEFNFYNQLQIKSESIYNDKFRKAAEQLMVLGTALALRQILSDAILSNIDDLFSGLTDVILSAIERCSNNLGEKDFTFLEAICPCICDHFINQRSKGIVGLKDINPIQFFFFLGLLLANDKWNDLRFDPANDIFTYNLHLIPLAIEKIVQMKGVLFPKSDAKQFEEAIRVFFMAASSIAKGKKSNKNRQQYNSFMILIDHFPTVARTFDYRLIEQDFPYANVRACYNDIIY